MDGMKGLTFFVTILAIAAAFAAPSGAKGDPQGAGGLLLQARTTVISSPSDGLPCSFNVENGDWVVKGQQLGRIFVNDEEVRLLTAYNWDDENDIPHNDWLIDDIF